MNRTTWMLKKQIPEKQIFIYFSSFWENGHKFINFPDKRMHYPEKLTDICPKTVQEYWKSHIFADSENDPVFQIFWLKFDVILPLRLLFSRHMCIYNTHSYSFNAQNMYKYICEVI